MGDVIINYIDLMIKWNRVCLLGVTIIILIRGLLMGGDGLINNNRIFS